MNKKAFMKGYLGKQAASLLAGAAAIPAAAKAAPSAKQLLTALGLSATGSAAVGYGASRLGAPSQTDLDNEVKKMQLGEAEELLETLKAHQARKTQGTEDVGKALYI